MLFLVMALLHFFIKLLVRFFNIIEYPIPLLQKLIVFFLVLLIKLFKMSLVVFNYHEIL